ncbi:hypothetical protein JCM3263A_26670 [Thermobifida fusca]|uniref:Probable serine/threonine-protein kinase PkwA n=3 Tax=Streptosporangiales TaxID=85012 RepID=PKWA_THECU|nr:serine/threonine-protein kinase [Thermobifida fusca]P49695.1 RecName: Full=Probable serine/threonine-protein kinase PkwA [Thermomonospora curvata]AAB05822.1 PkwA [Thermomonospora curvata]AAZ54094.1 Tyrosine protein kinase:WD-40 repeat:Serine/threonine protein kinase [Thermobifida fusca YX]
MIEPLQPGDPGRIGPYRLVSRLGAGGMGQVFLARSPGGRPVVVKVILPEYANDDEYRIRFAREVEAARRVGGFHTAQVIDADPTADPPWMATAYIPGPSLRKAVTERGPLYGNNLRTLAAGLVEGLAAIHACGLVHRDFKPSNIVLAADGPRVIDFGVARPLDSSVMTQSGAVIGTLAYMSPEQTDGSQVGPASDVFSLGTVLAFAATGRSPFMADSIGEIIARISGPPPELPELPDDLRELVYACWEQNPDLRPTTAELLAQLSTDHTGDDWPPPHLSDLIGSMLPLGATTSPNPSLAIEPPPPSHGPPRPSEPLPDPGDDADEPSAEKPSRTLPEPEPPELEEKPIQVIHEPERPAPTPPRPREPARGAIKPKNPRPAAPQPPWSPPRVQPPRWKQLITKKPVAGILTAVATAGLVVSFLVWQWTLPETPLRPDSSTAPSESADPHELNEPRILTTDREAVAVAFSPGGSLLAGGSGDKLIHVWDVASGDELHTLEGHTDWVRAVAFSPDGALLASGSDDATVRLWDVAAAEERAVFEGHTHYVLDIAFSPDGSMVASGSRDGTARLWNVATGTEHAVLKGHTDYVYAVAFSPDGSMVASGSRDGTIRLWDVATGKERDVLQAPAENVVSLAFSPDGSMLVHGSDSTVHLWDVASGEALHTFEGHTDWVRAVAFSPDGALLASGSDDRTIRLWDVAAQEEHTTLEGHTEPVHSVAFHPEGTTLASASEDGTIRIWPIATE